MKASAHGMAPTLANACVVLVGRRSVQNGLLAVLIREHLGCLCDVRALYQLSGAPVAVGAMALLDVEGMSMADIAGCVETLCDNQSYGSIALFNVDESKVDEMALPGVKGVFFRDASPGHLIKGIRAVFAGEYWLPRRLLAAYFEKNQPQRLRFSKKTELTLKETETLRLMMRGNANRQIAVHLGVSAHTVKSHVYNLFRKLGVKNRVQAVNWAILNSERLESTSRNLSA